MEEARTGQKRTKRKFWRGRGQRKTTNPDAAWRPSPLDPPVTTATLPFKEKSEGKSLSSVSAIIFNPIVDDKVERRTRIANDN